METQVQKLKQHNLLVGQYEGVFTKQIIMAERALVLNHIATDLHVILTA